MATLQKTIADKFLAKLAEQYGYARVQCAEWSRAGGAVDEWLE